MDQEIIASYVWTADELIKAQENHARAQCRRRYRIGGKFVLLLMILAGWCNYQAHGWSILTVLLPSVAAYVLFLRKYDVRWSLRRHFKKRPDRDSRIVWTLGENDLQTRTDESQSRRNWSQVAKVRRAPNGFLLYPNDRMFQWLPASAFSCEEDRQRAEELLQSKIKDFAEIR